MYAYETDFSIVQTTPQSSYIPAPFLAVAHHTNSHWNKQYKGNVTKTKHTHIILDSNYGHNVQETPTYMFTC